MNIFSESELLSTSSLPVMEAFYTLQGEGRHTGRAAYFIRLAGCDVGCFWCDVKESWDASLHPTFEIETIVKNALEAPCKLAVITGIGYAFPRKNLKPHCLKLLLRRMN
jgi:organic radical activating enzyme